jgi:nicotinamidase-related amidase
MNRDLGVWTSENSALVLIDYQAELLEAIRSETAADLVELNARWLAKTAKAFDMPIVLSSVGSETAFSPRRNPRSSPSCLTSSRSTGRR